MEKRAKGRRWGKRLFGGLLLLMLVGIVLAFTYAYWLPVVGRPVAKRYGVTYGKFERLKDGRFAVTEVVRTNRNFDLRIARVEGYLPHIWRGKLDETNAAAAFVE